ncbi:MAG: hypothetical protein KDD60_07545 [Bdellovibrionales bacterium]|nr:hypothetical protein [Bdellovibrionales bacterium]
MDATQDGSQASAKVSRWTSAIAASPSASPPATNTTHHRLPARHATFHATGGNFASFHPLANRAPNKYRGETVSLDQIEKDFRENLEQSCNGLPDRSTKALLKFHFDPSIHGDRWEGTYTKSDNPYQSLLDIHHGVDALVTNGNITRNAASRLLKIESILEKEQMLKFLEATLADSLATVHQLQDTGIIDLQQGMQLMAINDIAERTALLAPLKLQLQSGTSATLMKLYIPQTKPK